MAPVRRSRWLGWLAQLEYRVAARRTLRVVRRYRGQESGELVLAIQDQQRCCEPTRLAQLPRLPGTLGHHLAQFGKRRGVTRGEAVRERGRGRRPAADL